MCIINKISQIQNALMGYTFTKSGHNRYTKRRYLELKDILPPIMNECNKHNLVLLFNFNSDYGYLDVTNKDNVEDYYRFSMPMPEELKPLNSQMNAIQSIGADATYLKRYLLINAFLILEDDVADALTNDTVRESEIVSESKESDKIPEKISEALRDLDAKGIKITKASVYSKVNSKLTDKDDRKFYIDWIDENVEGDE